MSGLGKAKTAASLFESSPVHSLMAALALRTESAPVLIVFPMAYRTGRRQNDLFVHR